MQVIFLRIAWWAAVERATDARHLAGFAHFSKHACTWNQTGSKRKTWEHGFRSHIGALARAVDAKLTKQMCVNQKVLQAYSALLLSKQQFPASVIKEEIKYELSLFLFYFFW